MKQNLRANGMLQGDLYEFLSELRTDVAAIRSAVVAITAKLDADAGVTDANYAATCNPAALTSSLDAG